MTFIQFVYDMEGSHMTFIQFVYDMEGSHMTFIQFVYDMEGGHMTFIQFVYDMESSHMTSSAVNTRWWSKRWSGHGLTNRTSAARPVMMSFHLYHNLSANSSCACPLSFSLISKQVMAW